MDLILRPFFLGGVMKETGNRPPMMVPAKGLYMAKDLARNAKYFALPINPIEVCQYNIAYLYFTVTIPICMF